MEFSRRIVVLLLVVIGSWSTARAASVEDLARLYREGRVAAAYEAARALLGRLEGDPRFDFVYGVAAIDSGHVGEGVFALERVLLAYPDDDRARLELARGYFLLREYGRARSEFQRVLARNPPPEVQASIGRFLERIRLEQARRRTSAAVFVESGVGYDSNVNGATASAFITTPAFPAGVTLDANSVARSARFGQLTVGARAEHLYAPGRTVYGVLNAERRAVPAASAFATGYLHGEAGLGFGRGDDRFRAGLLVQHFAVGGAAYRRLYGLRASWRRRLGRDTELFSAAGWLHQRYPGDAARNANLWTLRAGLTRGFDWRYRPRLTVFAFGGREDALSESNQARAVAERTLFGAAARAVLALGPALALEGSISAQRSRYRGVDPVFTVRRSDGTYAASGALTWLVGRRVSLIGSLAYYRNDSNIVLSDYDRYLARISLRFEYP